MFRINRKAIITLIGTGLLSVGALGPSEAATLCTQQAKICPDGSFVTPRGSDCQYPPCPGIPGTTEEPSLPSDDPSITDIPPETPEKTHQQPDTEQPGIDDIDDVNIAPSGNDKDNQKNNGDQETNAQEREPVYNEN